MKMNWVLVDATKPSDFVVAKECADILLRNGNYEMRKEVSNDIRDYCYSYEIEECEFVLHCKIDELDWVENIAYGDVPERNEDAAKFAQEALENLYEHSDAAYRIEYYKDESEDYIPMAWTRIDE